MSVTITIADGVMKSNIINFKNPTSKIPKKIIFKVKYTNNIGKKIDNL